MLEDAQGWEGSIVGKLDAAQEEKGLVDREIAHRWQGAGMPGAAQRVLRV